MDCYVVDQSIATICVYDPPHLHPHPHPPPPSLRSTMSQKKPFNPILGETYQGSLYDGTRLYMEQISHHPPISAWDLEAPDAAWRFSGVSEGTASFGGNSVRGAERGKMGIVGRAERIFFLYLWAYDV